MTKTILFAALVFVTLPQISFAGDEVINQLRFYYGLSSINPKQVNEAAEANSLGTMKKFDHYGLEAARDIAPYFNLGLRLGIRSARSTSTATSPVIGNEASLGQVSLIVMFTAPLIKTEKFKFEVFTGLGLSNSSFSIKNGTQEAKFTSSQSGPTTLIGAATAFGHKYVFLKIEGGYEYNKINGLAKTGTLTSNVDTLDLSGPYFNIGILVDGLKLGKL